MSTTRAALLAAAGLALAGCTAPAPAPEPAPEYSYGNEFEGPAPPGPWVVTGTGLCCHKIGIPGMPDPATFARCAPEAEYRATKDTDREPEHTRTVPITMDQFQHNAFPDGTPCPDRTTTPATSPTNSNL